MQVLILGENNDVHVQRVHAALAHVGAYPTIFNSADFPQKAKLSWCPQAAEGILTLANGAILRFKDIQAVYWRNLNPPHVPSTTAPEQAMIAHRDCLSTLRTFLNGTQARWVNSWAAYEYHKEKPLQLAEVNKLGIKIPSTLISNSASEIQAFYQNHSKVIYKPVYGGAHTEWLTEDLMAPERLQEVLRISPVTLQQYIPGTNIRTYVIGNKTFSAEIRSECVDFRDDGENAKLLPLPLPAALREKCISIRQTLGLEWTAIDWRRDHTGGYFFLEANPSPMFIHFEKITGHPITETLVQLLLSPRKGSNHVVNKASHTMSYQGDTRQIAMAAGNDDCA